MFSLSGLLGSEPITSALTLHCSANWVVDEDPYVGSRPIYWGHLYPWWEWDVKWSLRARKFFGLKFAISLIAFTTVMITSKFHPYSCSNWFPQIKLTLLQHDQLKMMINSSLLVGSHRPRYTDVQARPPPSSLLSSTCLWHLRLCSCSMHESQLDR